MKELGQLPTVEQMELLDELTSLTPKQLDDPRGKLGSVSRDNRTYFRLRSGEYRLYFERAREDALYLHYILHRNTTTDFVFRTRLPVTSETMGERDQSFWAYLESLKRVDED